MFVSEDSKRLNYKVVVVSEDRGLPLSIVHRLHEALPAESKGRLTGIGFGATRSVSFDFTPPEVEPIDGYQVRMHVYAIESGSVVPESEWAVAEARALAGVDGLLFAIRCDTNNQCDGAKLEGRIRASLEKAGYDWSKVPVAYEVHPKDAGSKPSLDAIRAKLGGTHNRPVVLAGDGAMAMTREVLSAYRVGNLNAPASEEAIAASERKKVRTFALGELYKNAGPGTAHSFPAKVVGEPDIFVFCFFTTDQRPYVTYATFARRLGAYELVAHAPDVDEQVMSALASINSGDFKPYALVESTNPRRSFLLVPPWGWPRDVAKAEVGFLQAVPVTNKERSFGKKAGGRALAERLNLAVHGPAFGWKRAEKDSVVSDD
ncbi:suppressor of fused domain protein [Myxococcaceae bacterium JPH2]|nr:suppressor of fused domain protein [Myxococcaceae bacterium JPH2]